MSDANMFEPKKTNDLLKRGGYGAIFVELVDRFDEKDEFIGFDCIVTDMVKNKNVIWFLNKDTDLKGFSQIINSVLYKLSKK